MVFLCNNIVFIMSRFESSNKQLVLSIRISDRTEIVKYQEGLMGLLRKIEIGNCDPELKENIKAVYELLSHFQIKSL